MALIKCPECGKDVSDKAVACPNCGHPIAGINQPSDNQDLETTQNSEIDSNSETNLSPEPITNLATIPNAEPNMDNQTPKNKKKTKFVIVGIIAIIICVVAFVMYNKHQAELAEQKAQQDNVATYNLCVDALNQLYLQSWQGASYAEEVCVLVANTWQDRIYQNYDSDKTSKYTKDTEDFNEAVQNVYDDADTKENLNKVSDSKDNIDSLMKDIQNAPDEFSKCQDAAADLYAAFNQIADLAKSPSGNLNSYLDNESDIVSEFKQAHDALMTVIPPKKEIPYFDDPTKKAANEMRCQYWLNQLISNCDYDWPEQTLNMFYKSEYPMYGIDGEVTCLTDVYGYVVSYVTWTSTGTIIPDDEEQIISAMKLLYGEPNDVSDEGSAGTKYTWSSGRYFETLTTNGDSIKISWTYTWYPTTKEES